jgi:hypothetical protein
VIKQHFQPSNARSRLRLLLYPVVLTSYNGTLKANPTLSFLTEAASQQQGQGKMTVYGQRPGTQLTTG